MARSAMRFIWLLLGLVFLGLGIAGAILPLLPATPFLLVAAYAFSRSSPRLHAWLLNHRHLGPLIENWRRYGAISRRDKTMAALVMVATFALSLAVGVNTTYLVIQAFALTAAAIFVLSRPSPPHSPG